MSETKGIEKVREYLASEYDDIQVLANDDNVLFEGELKELGEIHVITADPFYNDDGFAGFELVGECKGRRWEIGVIHL